MPTDTAEKKTRKRNGPRKNYQKALERVTTYLETVIRIKGQSFSDGAQPGNDVLAGELRAYKDLLDFIGVSK